MLTCDPSIRRRCVTVSARLGVDQMEDKEPVKALIVAVVGSVLGSLAIVDERVET
jgi:hypothetical protein